MKGLSIFAGFVRRQMASRWVGYRERSERQFLFSGIFDKIGSDFVI